MRDSVSCVPKIGVRGGCSNSLAEGKGRLDRRGRVAAETTALFFGRGDQVGDGLTGLFLSLELVGISRGGKYCFNYVPRGGGEVRGGEIITSQHCLEGGDSEGHGAVGVPE